MPTYRVNKNKDNPYVQINKRLFEDKQLSFKAKGLLGYLLTKPDTWLVYEKELVTASKDGRDSVRGTIKELMEAGYLKRYRARDDKGLLRHSVCDVYETPELGRPPVSEEDARINHIIEAFSRSGVDIDVESTPDEVREDLRRAIRGNTMTPGEKQKLSLAFSKAGRGE